MKSSKLALSFVLATLVAGCGKTSTNNDTAMAVPQPAAETPPPAVINPPVVATTPPTVMTTQAPIIVSQPSSSSEPPSVQQFAQASRAVQEQKDYTYAQKSDFIASMMTARDELHQQLIQIAAKINVASDAVQKDEQPKLGALQTQLSDLDAKMDQVNISTESNWDQTKADALQAYESTKQAIQDTNQRLTQVANNN